MKMNMRSAPSSPTNDSTTQPKVHPGIHDTAYLVELVNSISMIRAMARKCENYWDVERNQDLDRQKRADHLEIDEVVKGILGKRQSDAQSPDAVGYALATYLKETGQAGVVIQDCYLLPDDLGEDEIQGIIRVLEEAFKEKDPTSSLLILWDRELPLTWVGDHGAVRETLERRCSDLETFKSSLASVQQEDKVEQPVQGPLNNPDFIPPTALKIMKQSEQRTQLQNKKGVLPEGESPPATDKEQVLDILKNELKIPEILIPESEMYRILNLKYTPVE